MAEIQLKNVYKRWGDFVGVDNFNLTIADQEFLVLLGPSGCGKTTTMRMIVGLEQVTEGDILINGVRVNEHDPKDRDTAMVFQSYGLYPHLSAYENIRFPLKVRKVDASTHDERVRKAAAMVEIEPFLARKPAELSGGQRQRVALARAIVREPQVFLMDEPLSNLDAKLRVSTRAQIKHLSHSLKTTTVYVTHDQTEAMTLADRIVVMNQGRIMQQGSPREVYERPANRFVAGFMGYPAMNLMQGTIENGCFRGENVSVEGLTAADGPMTLGFRAEDAQIGGAELQKVHISAPVYTREMLGDVTMVSVRAGGELVTVRAPKDYAPEIGSMVCVHIPKTACHLFHHQSGERLSCNSD